MKRTMGLFVFGCLTLGAAAGMQCATDFYGLGGNAATSFTAVFSGDAERPDAVSTTGTGMGTFMLNAAETELVQGGEIAGIGSINGELLLGCGDAVGPGSRGLVALADPRPSPLCPDCTGVIEVIGDFTQCELGELDIAFYEPVGGESANGSVHDRLAVSAVATLGGKLTVRLDGPFDPPDGAVFNVVTAEVIQGEFSEVQVPRLPGDRTFEVIYNPNAVQLRVVAGCPWDLVPNGSVGIADLLFLIEFWNNPYGIGDLLALLDAWGDCP